MNDGAWDEGMTALHDHWNRALDGPHYRRDDKRVWQAIERAYESARGAGDAAGMAGAVDAAARFADEAVRGAAVWPEGRPQYMSR